MTGLSMIAYAFDPTSGQARPDHVFKTAAPQLLHSGRALTTKIGTVLPDCLEWMSLTTGHGKAQRLNRRAGTQHSLSNKIPEEEPFGCRSREQGAINIEHRRYHRSPLNVWSRESERPGWLT